MGKHVQTVVPETTYTRLRRRSQEENRPIKDLVREAVEAYIQEKDESDPLDDVVGSLEIGGGWSTRKDWREPFESDGDDEAAR